MFASTVTSRVRPGHRKPHRLNKLISSPLNNTSASFCCFTEVLFSYRTRGCSCILSQGACQRVFFSDIFEVAVELLCFSRIFVSCIFVSYKANGWVTIV